MHNAPLIPGAFSFPPYKYQAQLSSFSAAAAAHNNKRSCNDPNRERVQVALGGSVSYMYFKHGLEGVIKARQDAEDLIADYPQSKFLNLILTSTFATIDRGEKYFLDEIEAKKNKRKQLSSLISLPDSIRVYILNYLGGQTQDELTNLTLVSKQFYNDCKRPGIEWKIITVFEISLLKQHDGYVNRLLRNMEKLSLNNATNNKLQRYEHMQVHAAFKYNEATDLSLSITDIRRLTTNIQLNGITSLDMSCNFPQFRRYGQIPVNIYDMLANVLPNLDEVDLSNTNTLVHLITTNTLHEFSKNCKQLEKITCHNTTFGGFKLNGDQLRSFSISNNLKELYTDDSVFANYDNDYSIFCNNGFIFHRCCNSLERVSIRNAKLIAFIGYCKVPQHALIKFVRMVPSLRWFRSDLTQDNMNMLRLERPEVELFN